MDSSIAGKKFTILKRNPTSKEDDSQPKPVTPPTSFTVEDTSLKPPDPIPVPKPDDSVKTLDSIPKSAQQHSAQQSSHLTNDTHNNHKKTKKEKKDKREKKEKNNVDKQAQNQPCGKTNSTATSKNITQNNDEKPQLVEQKKDKNALDNQVKNQPSGKVTSTSTTVIQNNSEKSQLIERKKNISDKICDFVYSGKYLSQKEFLYLRREREDICDKLEKLNLNPKNQDAYSTTSSSTANTKSNEYNTASELNNTYSPEAKSVQKSNTAPKSDSKDSTKSKVKNLPPPTLPFKKEKEQKDEGPEPEYEWSDDVREALFKVFGMSRFRHNQLKAINATLRGDDIFVLMPTGGGKSLCYQLPAIIDSGKTKGVTIVVSPLLALAQDQAYNLNALGIHAFALNSDSTAEEKINFFSDLKSPDPQIKLAYITPEMLNKSTGIQDLLKELYERKKLARFVIDEAHCVSQWGHDFRPDYKHIGFVKTLYPDIPLIALTATANDRVKEDVKKRLYISNCLTLTQSFNRKNLFYEIREKNDKTVVSDIYNYISENHPDSCGIIYCQSRKACEELAEELSSEYDLQIERYHAGLNKEDRQRIQRDWHDGVFKVIVATVAFGMGIDKPDVRFVIHHSLPHSIEEYYQETGRAGRDGIESECILYYNYSDKQKIERFIDDGKGQYDAIVHKKNNLNKVVQFCENLTDCKREQILTYFGEKFDRVFCYQSCDNCITALSYKFVQKDVTAIAKNIVKIVRVTQKQNISMRVLLLLIKGSCSKESKSYNLVPPLLGCGKDISVSDAKRLIHDLIFKKILIESSIYNRIGYASTCLFTGPSSKHLLNGETSIKLPFKEPLVKIE